MRKRRIIVAVLLALLWVGCAAKKNPAVTPQYQAAVNVDSFSQALLTLQNTEISLYANGTGPIDLSTHKAIEGVFLQLGLTGQQMNAAIQQGNYSSAQIYINAAIAAAKSINPILVGIKDPNTQAALTAAVTTFVTITTQWASTLPHAELRVDPVPCEAFTNGIPCSYTGHGDKGGI